MRQVCLISCTVFQIDIWTCLECSYINGEDKKVFLIKAIIKSDFLFKRCCVCIICSLAPVGRTKRRSGGGRVLREEKSRTKWSEDRMKCFAWTGERECGERGGKTVGKETENKSLHLPTSPLSTTRRFHPSPCLRLSGNMERDYRGEAGGCSHFSFQIKKTPNYWTVTEWDKCPSGYSSHTADCPISQPRSSLFT